MSADNRIWIYIVCDDPDDVEKVGDLDMGIEVAIEKELKEEYDIERNATVRGVYTWDEEKEILICSKCGVIGNPPKQETWCCEVCGTEEDSDTCQKCGKINWEWATNDKGAIK